MSLEVSVRRRLAGFQLDVAFSAAPGVTALFGRSGAGKSTLAGLVAGLTRPDEGRIVLDGRILVDTAARSFVPRHRRRIGVVFQEGRLFPHMSVRKNLLFGRRFAPRSDRAGEPEHIVELLGLGNLLDRRPRDLSGGERQRVAIGRALLMNPLALVMDEPLAALDDARKAEILPYVERLRDELRMPVLYISHSVAEVLRLATTVVVLDSGRVAATGTPSEILATGSGIIRPHEVGSIIAAQVIGHDDGAFLTRLRFAGGDLVVPFVPAAIGSELRLQIPARDVILALERPAAISAQNLIRATVTEIRVIERPSVEIRLLASGITLLAHITGYSAGQLGLRPGTEVWAILKTLAIDPLSVRRPASALPGR